MSLRRSSRVSTSTSEVNGMAASKNLPKRRAADSDVARKSAVKKPKLAAASEGSLTQSQGAATVLAEAEFKVPAVPVKTRRRRVPKASVPKLTPTPSLANAMRAPYSSGDIDDATPPPMDRPVEPHMSNAILVTPSGTQMAAYSSGAPESSPSKTGMPRPTATTGTILHKACAHLIKVDARLKPVIEKYPCPLFSAQGLAEEIDPFRSLSSGIMGQQVSGAAAKSIKNKFIALFNENNEGMQKFPTPEEVAKTDLERLRLAGLSGRKAEYIQGLAQKFASGELSAKMLMNASDEEVMERLIAVRGLGKWSVEMFACFGLKRMDILSTGDLGVQRGMAAFYGKDVKKLKSKGGGKWKYMSEQDMLDKSAAFEPYRSLFMWYMWRVEDVDVSVMNNS